jgi:LysM repeat protein
MGLKQAGYATNPDYPNILIRLIETNRLFDFDHMTTIEIDTLIAPGAQKPEVKEAREDIVKTPVSQRWIFKKGYKMPDPSTFEIIKLSPLGRKVYENNGIPFIFAAKGDTWYSIGKEFGIYAFQVYHDNDLEENDMISIGQIIYLESKKRKNPANEHLVQKEDSMYSISQQYGIKLKLLYKYNDLETGEEPSVGKIVKLHPGRFFEF